MKPCKQCQKDFEPRNSLDRVCGWKCALKLAKAKSDKKRKIEFNRETKRRKEAAKTRSDHMKDCQKAYNAYIRKRDEGNLCISCQKPPRKKNAGHYKSVGSSPELRFNEDNTHLQCEYCNTYKSGNQIEYRINLVNKIGEERVLKLEGPQEPKKYTIDDLIEIKRYYREREK